MGSPALETAWVCRRPSAGHANCTSMGVEKHADLRHLLPVIWLQNDFSPVLVSTAVSATSAGKRMLETCIGVPPRALQIGAVHCGPAGAVGLRTAEKTVAFRKKTPFRAAIGWSIRNRRCSGFLTSRPASTRPRIFDQVFSSWGIDFSVETRQYKSTRATFPPYESPGKTLLTIVS